MTAEELAALNEQIIALPTADKLRVAADLIDENRQIGAALQIVEAAQDEIAAKLMTITDRT
jgi:exopolyphosphatase/pppGpp-phosphohydrolase